MIFKKNLIFNKKKMKKNPLKKLNQNIQRYLINFRMIFNKNNKKLNKK